MKKIYILSLIVIFFTLNCIAQPVDLAIRGGANYSTARAYFKNVKQPTGYKLGGNVGVMADIPFDGGIYFSPLVMYNMKGYSISPLADTFDKVENTIHYVDLMPRFTYHFSSGESNSFVIGTGIGLGLALAGTEKITKNGVTSSKKMNFDISKDYGYFDFSLMPLMGYYTKKFFVEGTFQMGLTSINNNEEKDQKNIRNSGFSVSLGYILKQY